ncbi:hypothetical protein C5167_028735 [Papaver somniferum]|nr:hypothetical protein C5167_028735 [Papaver somniferum]
MVGIFEFTSDSNKNLDFLSFVPQVEPLASVEEDLGSEEEIDVVEVERRMRVYSSLLKRMQKENITRVRVPNIKRDQTRTKKRVRRRRKKLQTTQDGILRGMLHMMEVCKAQGFAYGIILENGKSATGASDNLRGWWKEKVGFSRNAPIVIEQYKDTTLRYILSTLIQGCNPAQRKFPIERDEKMTSQQIETWQAIINQEETFYSNLHPWNLSLMSSSGGSTGSPITISDDSSDHDVQGVEVESNMEVQQSKPSDMNLSNPVGVAILYGANERITAQPSEREISHLDFFRKTKPSDDLETVVDSNRENKRPCLSSNYCSGFLGRTSRNDHQGSSAHGSYSSQATPPPIEDISRFEKEDEHVENSIDNLASSSDPNVRQLRNPNSHVWFDGVIDDQSSIRNKVQLVESMGSGHILEETSNAVDRTPMSPNMNLAMDQNIFPVHEIQFEQDLSDITTDIFSFNSDSNMAFNDYRIQEEGISLWNF